MTTIDTVTIQTEPFPAIVLGGTGSAPHQVALRGTRQHLAGQVESAPERWSAVIPLLNSQWKSAPMPPRSGRYIVGDVVVDAQLPASQLIEGVTRVSFER